MNKIKRLENIDLKMLETYQKYNDIIKGNDEFKDKFGGFKVWFSPIIINPKVMIIGINPGINELTQNKDINLKPSDIFEYLNPKTSYDLAVKANKSFKMAGLYEVLENDTIKTNFYHLITSKEAEMKFYFNKIRKGLFREYEKDSKLIIKEMIEIISPENILCESIVRYRELKNIYSDRIEIPIKNGVGYTKVSNPNFNLIGFNRRASSAESLSIILKKVIHSE